MSTPTPLPLEVWSLIFTELEETLADDWPGWSPERHDELVSIRRQAGRACSLVSRDFLEHGRRLLYATVDNRDTLPKLSERAKHLGENPHLASYVTTLSVAPTAKSDFDCLPAILVACPNILTFGMLEPSDAVPEAEEEADDDDAEVELVHALLSHLDEDTTGFMSQLRHLHLHCCPGESYCCPPSSRPSRTGSWQTPLRSARPPFCSASPTALLLRHRPPHQHWPSSCPSSPCPSVGAYLASSESSIVSMRFDAFPWINALSASSLPPTSSPFFAFPFHFPPAAPFLAPSPKSLPWTPSSRAYASASVASLFAFARRFSLALASLIALVQRGKEGTSLAAMAALRSEMKRSSSSTVEHMIETRIVSRSPDEAV